GRAGPGGGGEPRRARGGVGARESEHLRQRIFRRRIGGTQLAVQGASVRGRRVDGIEHRQQRIGGGGVERQGGDDGLGREERSGNPAREAPEQRRGEARGAQGVARQLGRPEAISL